MKLIFLIGNIWNFPEASLCHPMCTDRKMKDLSSLNLLWFKDVFVILCRERDHVVQQCVIFTFVITCIKYLSSCSATYLKTKIWNIPSIHQQQSLFSFTLLWDAKINFLKIWKCCKLTKYLKQWVVSVEKVLRE